MDDRFRTVWVRLSGIDRLGSAGVIDVQTKAITAIEDEARRANVPSGWLRP